MLKMFIEWRGQYQKIISLSTFFAGCGGKNWSGKLAALVPKMFVSIATIDDYS
jgi:hypothetical protein